MKDIKLDSQTANHITALNLNEHRKLLRKLSKEKSTHPEDRVRYADLADAMDLLVKTYFQVPR